MLRFAGVQLHLCQLRHPFAISCTILLHLQTATIMHSELIPGVLVQGAAELREAVAADASSAVSILVRAEQFASEVLARLGRSHASMAGLLEGQAASMAAQLPEMQEVVTCAICLEKQISALSAGVMRCQTELDEKAQSLSTLVSTSWAFTNPAPAVPIAFLPCRGAGRCPKALKVP